MVAVEGEFGVGAAPGSPAELVVAELVVDGIDPGGSGVGTLCGEGMGEGGDEGVIGDGVTPGAVWLATPPGADVVPPLGALDGADVWATATDIVESVMARKGTANRFIITSVNRPMRGKTHCQCFR